MRGNRVQIAAGDRNKSSPISHYEPRKVSLRPVGRGVFDADADQKLPPLTLYRPESLKNESPQVFMGSTANSFEAELEAEGAPKLELLRQITPSQTALPEREDPREFKLDSRPRKSVLVKTPSDEIRLPRRRGTVNFKDKVEVVEVENWKILNVDTGREKSRARENTSAKGCRVF